MTIFKTAALGAALAASLLVAQPAKAQKPQCATLDCIRDAVTKIAKKGLEDKQFVGMSVLVVDREKGSFNSHFGYQDLENKVPTSKNTIYELGSITKPVTFLTLAVQDKVKVSDSIRTYLPKGIRNPTPKGKDIRFAHLITHTSGFLKQPCVVRAKTPDKVDCYGQTDDREDPYKNLTEKAFYEWLHNSSFMFDEFPDYFKAPGYHREYSSVGTALAGELVARAHGMSFEDYVHKKILDPLKMDGSFLSLPCTKGKNCENLAKVYAKRELSDPWRQTKLRTAPFAKGTGRLKSTTIDMEKYLRANLAPDSTPLAAAIKASHQPMAEITAQHNSNICANKDDAKTQTCNRRKKELHFGWPKSSSSPLFYHGGATTGSQSVMTFTQDGSFGVVILQNSIAKEPWYAHDLGMCILEIAGKEKSTYWCEAFGG